MSRIFETMMAMADAMAPSGPDTTPRDRWHVWDSARGRPAHTPHLGHGPQCAATRSLWCYKKTPAARGLVVHCMGRALRWEIDDGQGIIEDGTARRCRDLVDAAWPRMAVLLVDPGDVAWHIIVKAVSADPDLRQVGSMSKGPDGIMWGPLGVLFGPPPMLLCGSPERLPASAPRLVRDRATRGRDQDVMLRQTVPAAARGRRMAALLLDMAEQMVGLRDPRRGDRIAFGHVLDVRVPWALDWRPTEAPADVRDAAGGAATRSQPVSESEWQRRLDDYAAAETARQRATRLQRAGERLAMQLHVPPAGADPTGQVTTCRWSSAPVGGARLPVPTDLVLALWCIGFGSRLISELLVGGQGAKSAVHRRIDEARSGADGHEVVSGADLVARKGLGAWVEPSASREEAVSEPCGEPSASREEAVSEPCGEPSANRPAQPPADERDAPPARITVRRRERPEASPADDRDAQPIHLGTWGRIDDKLREALHDVPLAVRWHGYADPAEGVIVVARGMSTCNVHRSGRIVCGSVERQVPPGLRGDSPDAVDIDEGVHAILDTLVDAQVLAWDDVPLTFRPDAWWDAQAAIDRQLVARTK